MSTAEHYHTCYNAMSSCLYSKRGMTLWRVRACHWSLILILVMVNMEWLTSFLLGICFVNMIRWEGWFSFYSKQNY